MKNIYVWLIFSFLFLASCKKDSISPTQAEITASNLKNSIGSITNVTVFNMTDESVMLNGNSITISDNGLATVIAGSGTSASYTTFNLGLLKAYQVIGVNLNLFF